MNMYARTSGDDITLCVDSMHATGHGIYATGGVCSCMISVRNILNY
jgi:hypothetical protein